MKTLLKVLLTPLRILFLILSPFWGIAMIPVKIINGLLYIAIGAKIGFAIFGLEKITFNLSGFILVIFVFMICQVILNLPNIIEYVYCSTCD